VAGQKLLILANDTSGLCLDCHRPGQQASGVLGHKSVAGASKHSYKVTGKYPSLTDYNYNCVTCHNPHGTANLAMVKPVIDGGLGAGPVTAVFTDSTKFDPTGSATYGVCDACHAVGGKPHARTSKGSNHNEGNACWACHGHSVSFDTIPAVIQSLSVLPKDTIANRGGYNQFRVFGTDQYGNESDLSAQVVWLTRNTSVATVNATGRVTTLALGQTIVRAGYGLLTDSTRLTVSSSLEMSQLISITLLPASPAVNVNGNLQLTATGAFPGIVSATITDSLAWASSNAGIATISSAGLVHGISSGSALIKGSYNSVITFLALTVNP
jgi:hypothetical protein